MFACTGRQPPGSPKSSPPSAVPRFSPRSSLAPLPLTSGGLSTAPPALALNDSGGKISVLFWLESLVSALRCESGIHDTRIQGQHLRRLIEGPILDQLHRKIEELPGLRAATEAGTATFADYATALIACADPDDTLAVHRVATHPALRADEKLSDAVACTELAFRSASAHGCQPARGEGFRCWAVFCLLTAAERSTFTGHFRVRSRMQRPLRESEEAATARHAALLSDLLAWANVKSH
jgi:hypothetical protein